jgi:hypothetical protein
MSITLLLNESLLRSQTMVEERGVFLGVSKEAA